ncbi:hypothetical protein H6776_01355 [Candidatus Nomurabacteria bacterium]|nr:hypothetical protein [Candidatus Nomurabacteria bacterium]
MKPISKIKYFLTKAQHKILDNKVLFKTQTEFANFAVNVSSKKNTFFGKNSESIRPYINQQLKTETELGSKRISNHFETYKVIVLERCKKLIPGVSDFELSKFIFEFKEYFSKENMFKEKSKTEQVTKWMSDTIDSETLFHLSIVAKARGGILTYQEFLEALKNLTQDP